MGFINIIISYENIFIFLNMICPVVIAVWIIIVAVMIFNLLRAK